MTPRRAGSSAGDASHPSRQDASDPSRQDASGLSLPDASGPSLEDARGLPPADPGDLSGNGTDGSDGEPPPVDDFASQVLDVVDAIPPGRVMSYGDIAAYLAAGPGPRQVGRVMAVYGGAVAWWRVIHSDGTPAPGHDSRALKHYLAEGTPLRSARPPVRVDMRRARWPGS